MELKRFLPHSSTVKAPCFHAFCLSKKVSLSEIKINNEKQNMLYNLSSIDIIFYGNWSSSNLKLSYDTAQII